MLGLSGELKKIQGGGSDLFKGPLLPFSKTVGLLFEVSTALSVSLPLLAILGGEGYCQYTENIPCTVSSASYSDTQKNGQCFHK